MDIDWNKYKNTQTYPNKGDFLKPLLAKVDEMPLTRAEYVAKVAQAQKEAEQAYQASILDYRAEEGQNLESFWKDMEDYHGFGHLTDKQKGYIRQLAWERGHSGGLQEVHNALYDVVEFTFNILEAK